MWYWAVACSLMSIQDQTTLILESRTRIVVAKCPTWRQSHRQYCWPTNFYIWKLIQTCNSWCRSGSIFKPGHEIIAPWTAYNYILFNRFESFYFCKYGCDFTLACRFIVWYQAFELDLLARFGFWNFGAVSGVGQVQKCYSKFKWN